jgi:hypothetical protein
MGMWVPRPALEPGEELWWEANATRKQGHGRAVGGRLFLTNRRLFFEPSRFDRMFSGTAWSAPLSHIRRVETEPSHPASAIRGDYGALRRRLGVTTTHGTELFVVTSVEQVVAALNDVIPGLEASHASSDVVTGSSAPLGWLERVQLCYRLLTTAGFFCLLVGVSLSLVGHGSAASLGNAVAGAALALGALNVVVLVLTRFQREKFTENPWDDDLHQPWTSER